MTPALVLEDLAVAPRGAIRAVASGISLSLEAGAILLVAGANGAGKTTLLETVAGLVAPVAGRVHAQGPVRLLMQEAEHQVLGATLLEDVLLPFPAADAAFKSRAEALLAAYGFKDPEADARRLSCGGTRKLALVAALIESPKVLVMDEPTAGLDWPSTQALLSDAARLAREGVALVIATHEPALFAPMLGTGDAVLVLAEGKGQRLPPESAAETVARHPEWGVRPWFAA